VNNESYYIRTNYSVGFSLACGAFCSISFACGAFCFYKKKLSAALAFGYIKNLVSGASHFSGLFSLPQLAALRLESAESTETV